MIIANGTIELKQKTSVGGIDPTTGYAIKAQSATWGDPIPCQFSAVRYSNLALSNGEPVTNASYSILIEEQAFEAEQIRLKDRNGNNVGKGEYSIIQVEPLEAVCELRITV